jgi:hypothetical protein
MTKILALVAVVFFMSAFLWICYVAITNGSKPKKQGSAQDS